MKYALFEKSIFSNMVITQMVKCWVNRLIYLNESVE